MMPAGISDRALTICAALAVVFAAKADISAESPSPTLESVFPAGGTAGTTVELTVAGSAAAKLQSLHANLPGFHCELLDATRCRVTLPPGTPPGIYDLWALSENRITAPRRFFVSHRKELLESTANNSPATAEAVPLNSVINGRIEQPGDQDCFQFEAREGQRVVIEAWSERIDSRLRAVLEVFDSQDRRLAVNRGYYGVDPLIDFHVPADGRYVVKIHDLISTGGAEHSYRLEFDTGPRVAFTVPNVVPRGQSSRVTFFGWNLTNAGTSSHPATSALDAVEVDIPASQAQETWPLPVGLAPAQVVWAGFPYHFPGSHAAVVIGVTDLPVATDLPDNHVPTSAQKILHPCEVSGRLVDGDERDWFALDAARGEVLYFDVLSQRIGSPTDLQLSLFDSRGEQQLAVQNDQIGNPGGVTLPVAHLDPAGRWVVPADGRYLIMIRNLIGGSQPDLRRNYRLRVQREEPDFQLVLVPRSAAPMGLNLRRGDRTAFDVLAIRQRGMADAIRISAAELPAGIVCPPVTIGPGVERVTMVVSAEDSAVEQLTSLKLTGAAESVGKRPVRGSTVVRAGVPQGWSRLTSEIPLAVSGEAPVRITATIPESFHHHLYGKLRPRFAPGSVLDVTVTMEQRNQQHPPAARLSGVGLPPAISNQTTEIPAGTRSASLSFYLPPTLPVGEYSLAISAETTVPAAGGKSEPVTVISNPITLTVEPAAFVVAVDPFAPRKLKRGATVQVKYSTVRCNGFIGKIHTELASPGVVTDVPGLLGRGVTFVGQSEQGTIQIVVNEDAPLGPQPFLRFLGVGVVEDQAVFQGADLFPVEIVE